MAVSFGGANNNELAVGCANPQKLLSAYRSVVERYNLNTIDLDLENRALTDVAAGKKLAVCVTLPVSPQGLTRDGVHAVAQLLKHGVDLAGVNIMTMDYGSSLSPGQTMLTASESAITHTEHQLKSLYQQAGMHLHNTTLWSKMGITPMIGQNDNRNEVFTLRDAKRLNKFALSRGLGRMSMWSVNRDIMCGSNYVNDHVVSDSCSGVQQAQYAFSDTLGKGFEGNLFLSAGYSAALAAANRQKPDSPATSPYQIWSATGTYVAGEKVVWQHYIYIAKWWTEGNVPNNPVLQSWQTPWTLIGPVLPGERPISQPTLPKGTYPAWSGTAVYQAGQRVIFQGVPYQAKWWNQGGSLGERHADRSHEVGTGNVLRQRRHTGVGIGDDPLRRLIAV